MRSFRLVPDGTHIRFMHYQYWGYAFSGALILLTLILVPLKGLNFGVDFRGGLLIEARVPGTTADLGTMRVASRRSRPGRSGPADVRRAQ